jgi:hypothetical protein
LLEIFPKKLGFDLPEFPPKTIFRPSFRVAEERVTLLTEYFEKLLQNGHYCSTSTVKDFLSKNTKEDMRNTIKIAGAPGKLEIGLPVVQEEYKLRENWTQGGIKELPSLEAGKVKLKFIYKISYLLITKRSRWIKGVGAF